MVDYEEGFSDDHFEEDSICSWMSESEYIYNWRGWKRQNNVGPPVMYSNSSTNCSDKEGQLLSLTELAAREVASSIPFELVEKYYPPVPEQIQLRIAFWSFPEQEEDIRLYSCLANGSVDEFIKGEHLLRSQVVKDPLQIGFHLSATIVPGNGKPCQSTSVTFDRRKIVSCQCSCESKVEWCSHIVALCLHRIHLANTVCLRAPVSESLSRLHRDQLQKFAQYLIAELPLQILPTAQRILDELLSVTPTAINTVCGAPDPTAGGSTGEQSSFCLDSKNLRSNVKKILIKFCIPAPIVFSDVNYLSTTSPPSASEWCSFLRPLRGREPEGMWNLLSIVREMFKRNDRNSIPVLEIVTLQCLETAQIIIWWFNTKVALQQKSPGKHNVNSNSQASQNACASLCDEIVTLWKLAALNPCISPQERQLLKQRLISYHTTVIEKIRANQSSSSSGNVNKSGGNNRNKLNDLELFPGFKPALEGCILDWADYPISGVTYGHNSHYLSPFANFKQNQALDNSSSQVNSSQAVLRCEYPAATRSHNDNNSNNNDNNGEAAAIAANAIEADEGVVLNRVESVVDAVAGAAAGAAASNDENDRDLDSDWSSSAQDSDRRNSSDNIDTGPSANHGADHHNQDDQYRVYFYDTKVPVGRPNNDDDNSGNNNGGDKDKDQIDVFKNLRTSIEDPWEVLFMRAEGIHAHGYHNHACSMAVHLAHDMLKNPVDLLAELPSSSSSSSTSSTTSSNKKHKRSINAASHQITHTASTTLAHCAFLCTVLAENDRYHNLAFQIGMYGLEMARPPASTKAMEVKLAHQESELVNLLKKIPLGPRELVIVRERSVQLKEGTLKSRGEALLPLMLASFIFESLVLSPPPSSLYSDEQLGFEAAVASIGMKANVSEADHPLLCEGTRRQRGDLALVLLVHYKEDPEKIAKIMDKLLDKEVHPNFKAPVTPHYYVCNGGRAQIQVSEQARPDLENQMRALHLAGGGAEGNREVDGGAGPVPPPARSAPPGHWDAFFDGNEAGAEASSSGNGSPTLNSRMRHHRRIYHHHHHGETSNAASSSSQNGRGTQNGGSNGPGSDSGSSGNSSADSMDSSSSSSAAPSHRPHNLQRPHANTSPDALMAAHHATSSSNAPGIVNFPSGHPVMVSNFTNPQMVMDMKSNIASNNRSSSSAIPNIKVTRFKGKRSYPSVPNQPSESSAHFMFELAKTVLAKAGGNSSTSLFTPQQTAGGASNPRGPQRALHMCAFQIGLYALGLHNSVSPNWLSRTYSSHVSWITGQAMEIGAVAVNFLMGTWEGHLTPPEAASIADRASRGRDLHVVRAASDLALSVLPHAAALNPNEIQRAIQQCKERSSVMLEKACLAVEKAATGGGVHPEVLFQVARNWYELWKETLPQVNQQQQQQQQQQHHQHQHHMQNQHHQQLHVAAHYPFYGLISGLPQPPHPALQMYAVAAASPQTAAHPHQLHQQFQAAAAAQQQAAAVQAVAAAAAAAAAGPPTFQVYSHHGGVPTTHPRFGGGLYQLAIPGSLLQAPTAAPPPTTAPAVTASGSIAQIPVTVGNLLHPAQAPPQQPNQQQQAVAAAAVAAVAAAGPPPNAAAASSQRFLLSSYRVGMLALENLGRRVSEDRPQVRFARNPSYGEDVKWLMSISRKLGLTYLQNFLVVVGATIVSPFLLQDLAWEGASCLAGAYPAAAAATGAGGGGANNGQAQVAAVNPVGYSTVVQTLRSNPHLSQLANKCYQTYYQCIHQKLYHLPANEHEDFVAVVLNARKAFWWTAEGPSAFQTLLQSIRRSKACKKELWQKVLTSVQNASLEQQL